MDGTEYTKKACYEKALSLNPQDALAWSNLGLAGGGPEGGREGVGAAKGGVRWPFGGGSSRVVSGVCGEVKKWFFCEGVVESVEGLADFYQLAI